jgi:hypothetical protein
MCFSSPKPPPAPAPVAPPPMYVPESVDEEVSRAKALQRARAASSYGRQSTILASAFGNAGQAPTGQSKALTGQ